MGSIRVEDDVKGFMETVPARHGRIGFSINNGGGKFVSTAAKMRLKGWNTVIDTNLNDPFLMCVPYQPMGIKKREKNFNKN